MLLFTGAWQHLNYAVTADRGYFIAKIRASQYKPPTPNLFPAVSCTPLEETAVVACVPRSVRDSAAQPCAPGTIYLITRDGSND